MPFQEYRSPINADAIIPIVIGVAIGILVGRNAMVRGMNPWAWGASAARMAIVLVPVYLVVSSRNARSRKI
jgi:hypothetical protein